MLKSFVIRFFSLLVLCLFLIGVGAANYPVMNAENVTQIQSVLTIDFTEVPSSVGEIVNGWLRVNHDGRYVVMVNRVNDLLVWDITDGTLRTMYRVVGSDGTNANMMDIAWNDAGDAIHSLHTDGEQYFVGVYSLTSDVLRIVTVPSQDRPVRVWADDNADATWVEVLTLDPNLQPYILQLDVTTGAVLNQLSSIAEADRNSQVRIGRMPAPLAVTSSVEGVVHLWDLEAGELLEQVTVAGMPTFGHINGSAGRQLVWRDTTSATLNLLDFSSGENQIITELGGSYIQALLLTVNGDAVLGVNVDLEAVVVVWDVSTGERFELGDYRYCNRTPDMVELSEDGTTLVIGCDTGIDVWRVVEGE